MPAPVSALYLNIIYVGPNVYGIETGANYYFNKSVSDLSLEECAFLAGINNSPNSYNPYGDKDNTEKIKTRTKTVLSKMLKIKYINEDINILKAVIPLFLNVTDHIIKSITLLNNHTHQDSLNLSIINTTPQKLIMLLDASKKANFWLGINVSK